MTTRYELNELWARLPASNLPKRAQPPAAPADRHDEPEPPPSADSRRRAPVHEAAHAIVAMAVGARVFKVDITRGHAGVEFVTRPSPVRLREVTNHLAIVFAGYLGERRRFPRPRWIARYHFDSDLREVERTLKRLARDRVRAPERRAVLLASLRLANRILRASARPRAGARTRAHRARPYRR